MNNKDYSLRDNQEIPIDQPIEPEVKPEPPKESQEVWVKIGQKDYRLKQVRWNGQDVVFSKLTPQQQEKIKNLIQEQLNQIEEPEQKELSEIHITPVNIQSQKGKEYTKIGNTVKPSFEELQKTFSQLNRGGVEEDFEEKPIPEKPSQKIKEEKTSIEKKEVSEETNILLKDVTKTTGVVSPQIKKISSVAKGVPEILKPIHKALHPSKYSIANHSTEMKKAEEQNKLDCMKEVVKGLKKELGEISIDTLKTQLGDKEKVKTTKLQSQLAQMLAKAGKLPTPIPKEALRLISERIELDTSVPLYDQLWNIESKGNEDVITIVKRLLGMKKDEINPILESVENEMKGSVSFNQAQAAAELYAKIEDLVNVLKQPDKTAAEVNQEFTAKLRAALKSDAYQALKQDASNPAVKFLHHMSVAIWNRTKALDAYQTLGQSIVDKEEASAELTEPVTGESIANSIEESHEKLSKQLYTDHGKAAKVAYALTHPKHALGSLASEGGIWQKMTGVYDPMGNLHNNPSLQGSTTFGLGNNKVTVNNCYGGTPTVGDDEIAPEFLAVLQAAENNQLSDSPDQTVPSMISYTNLQNLDKKGGEGPRSRAIMSLNEKYPLSFSGLTISKDSKLYMMKEMKKLHVSKDPTTAMKPEKVDYFSNIMLNQLMMGVGPYSLQNKGHGFYFPGKKEEWEPVFKEMTSSATEYFKQKSVLEGKSEYEILGAYQEYVYSLIQVYQEAKQADVLAKRGIKDPTIMAIQACKENIDRGGMQNFKEMYLRMPPNHPNRMELLFGACFGRALACRDRLILSARMPNILNFMKSVEPDEFQKRQKSFLNKLNISLSDDYTFKPHL